MLRENEVRIDYSDIQMFIEIIEERAMKKGFVIYSIDDLNEYMYDNPSEPFSVISRHPIKEDDSND